MNLNKCLIVHGYIQSDNDSDNGYDSFDEVYNKHKPSPVPYNKFKHRIVNVHADTDVQGSSGANHDQRNYSESAPDPALSVESVFLCNRYDSDDLLEISTNQAWSNVSLSPVIPQRHGQISPVTQQHQANTRTQIPQPHRARSRTPKRKQAAAGPGTQQKKIKNARKYHNVPDLPAHVVVHQPQNRHAHQQPTPPSVNTTPSFPKSNQETNSTQRTISTISGNIRSHASNNSPVYQQLVDAEPAPRYNSRNRSGRQQQRQQQQQQQQNDVDKDCYNCCSVS